ncbi:MAG: GNAT family N-acetyltransferase [Chloroflexota bacterium]
MQQNITHYNVYTQTEFDERDDLIYPSELKGGMWATFMQQDPISDQYWVRFHDVYSDYQLYIAEGNRFIARIKSVPVFFEGDIADLPDAGWDWAIQNSIEIHEKGITPNMVSAIEITFLPEYRGQGLSTVGIKLMRLNAQRKGFDKLIAPVRPNQKHQFPLIPMEDYITWRREDGLSYDAWLRTHERLGAEIVKVAPQSMIIPGTIAEWHDWTGLEFPATGNYIVPEALSPIHIDYNSDQGIYYEPNVWMLHTI